MLNDTLFHKQFRVMAIDLDSGRGEVITFGDRTAHGGGSGLAAALFATYGDPAEPHDDPNQPLIFAIGPLTGYFPLMSKVVCGFKSPYHNQYSESHAGGRLALAIRFAGYDAIMIRGRAESPSAILLGSRHLQIDPVGYLWGLSVFRCGKLLRRLYPRGSGHRSMLRIGPAGEKGVAFASINVDSFRHFGRMGSGAVMGNKNLKAILVHGDENIALPAGNAYAKLYRQIHQQVTKTEQMNKYHDLGTAANLTPLNELKALPWRNLQQTSDPAVTDISGETFGDQLLLRQTACTGCPVGCIHMGMCRERYAKAHTFQYRQVSYDYEPIFAMGTMLGVTDSSKVLALLDEVEKAGVDVMSCGVALAWATEALATGLVGEDQTLLPLAFGEAEHYMIAIRHLSLAANEFYQRLGQGVGAAVAQYGGEEFACLLGQEMAGYATGEVFYTAQSLGFRHSHLDTGGYAYDQKSREQDLEAAIAFLIDDERERCILTSMVSCLFARGIYSTDLLSDALASIGHEGLARDLEPLGGRVQRLRWEMRFKTGFDPRSVKISKRLREVKTETGPIDNDYLDRLREAYGSRLMELGATTPPGEANPG
jgi:aldehyde:ferredoxin oxidoreductase